MKSKKATVFLKNFKFVYFEQILITRYSFFKTYLTLDIVFATIGVYF